MKKTLLIILDGYGINPNPRGNAIANAEQPYIDNLFKKYPHAQLKACGKDVGLPEGIMGNSEVGHLNIGAGKIVYQLNTFIDNKIETGDFFNNEALLSAIDHAQKHNSNIHLFGLLSDGGVHSSLNHIEALLKLLNKHNFKNAYMHAFMDGRDTLPHSGIDFIKNYIEKTDEYGCGKIASIHGRYYAMDRDNRWERVKKSYDALVHGIAEKENDPVVAIQKSYDKDITDEFIIPVIIEDIKIEDNDAIIFFNFRADRPRELTKTFIYNDFNEFETKKFNNLKYITMTEYDIKFSDYVQVAFKQKKPENILGEIISKNNCKQLRLAETEKYAHVTFFFNGGVEEPFPLEDRILIPSPKVDSYDRKPEMSAFQITCTLLDAIREKDYDFILVNYANCDMVGHTGVFHAVVKAVEAIDKCLSIVVPIAKSRGYKIIITADHGNADQMLDENGNIMTAHSMNKVPIIIISDDNTVPKDGILADIASYIL